MLVSVVSGQATVTQEHQFLSIKEGDSTLLNCSYHEVEYSLQWYKQYPGGPPDFMISRSSSGTQPEDNFEMTLDKKKRTTSLYLKNTQLKDSAVYFCAWSTVLQRHLLVVTKVEDNQDKDIELLFFFFEERSGEDLEPQPHNIKDLSFASQPRSFYTGSSCETPKIENRRTLAIILNSINGKIFEEQT
ncbi:PREDICTED: immunoglobulin iota chain-like [Thamnophis sirtalis]|uniref:immunoglobulin iota chain-like n=1 Tax=Thamnophis sirtalis TaxID=35019 RepID=UPI0006B14DFF|nr:PREDICTED: immunoglobulin iota chain-like [Thamnophis sirtalis]